MSIRKYKRAISRANMEKAGIAHPNRKLYRGRSFFALAWRAYLKGPHPEKARGR